MTKPTSQQVQSGVEALAEVGNRIAMEAMERLPDERKAFVDRAVALRRAAWQIESGDTEKGEAFLDGFAEQLARFTHGVVHLMEQSGGRTGHG